MVNFGFEFDFSDTEGFFSEGTWEVEKKMIDAGEDGVRYAEENGNYQDHTLKLRTSNGYDVDETGLVLTNNAKSEKGYSYASDVESKGYEVLGGAALFVCNKLKEELE